MKIIYLTQNTSDRIFYSWKCGFSKESHLIESYFTIRENYVFA